MRLGFRYLSTLLCVGLIAPIALRADPTLSPASDPIALAEMRRIEIIERVSPSVVCMFDHAKRGGGSGVIISPDGYGLTNYHVVAGMLETKKGWGGLGDGVLYELEVLGIDPTGDVAMFKLKGSGKLPFSTLGDSDAMKLGDPVLSVGNPFVMSEDYSPSVAMGIVTGMHRYQWGVSGNLTYSDCIQTDASINPGNSGGPLYNMAGEVVGINGRISVNTRGRYNVGFGYAISSNQVRRFIPALRAGLIAKHGTLLATLETDPDGALTFQRISSDSPLSNVGVHTGDRLVSLDNIPLRSPNHYVSLLGAYPQDWPAPLVIENGSERLTRIARLSPVEPKMKAEFTPDREANLTEARRILDRFRYATFSGDASASPKRRSWTIRRDALDKSGASEPQIFSATHAPGEAVQLVRKESGREGPTISYDSESATRREDAGAEPGRLPADLEMIYLALYVMQDRMLQPTESLDLGGVSATGADFPAGRDDLTFDHALPPWEVIDWSIAGHVLARYSFDPTTGRCMRIRVKDVPSGAEATIELMDHKDVGGFVWPGAMEITGPGYRFRDTLSDWNHSS